MATFGDKSKQLLATCSPEIQKVMNEVIKMTDFTIIEGTRTLERQTQLFKEGKSKLDGIKTKGKHNYSPSLAIDIAPYPIDWNDTKRFFFLAGMVMATAKSMGVNMIWGGDWDSDGDYADQTLMDYPHFQIGK